MRRSWSRTKRKNACKSFAKDSVKKKKSFARDGDWRESDDEAAATPVRLRALFVCEIGLDSSFGLPSSHWACLPVSLRLLSAQLKSDEERTLRCAGPDRGHSVAPAIHPCRIQPHPSAIACGPVRLIGQVTGSVWCCAPPPRRGSRSQARAPVLRVLSGDTHLQPLDCEARAQRAAVAGYDRNLPLGRLQHSLATVYYNAISSACLFGFNLHRLLPLLYCIVSIDYSCNNSNNWL